MIATAYVRFEIYSIHGLKLGDAETQDRGEQLLDAWFNAKFLIGIDEEGKRTCLRERTELR